LLRGLVLANETQLKNGKYIFVAKSDILTRPTKQLRGDFKYAIKKLDLFV